MKVNTDGVLLGALATANLPERILDIGAGTGVIALMLAQRFSNAIIDAVEVDAAAAITANRNFQTSSFSDRLKMFGTGFESYFETLPTVRYDLIVSNPPFFLNSLTSPGEKKTLAKHTDEPFFERLLSAISSHLTDRGICAMILPVETGVLVKKLLPQMNLHLNGRIVIKSFAESMPHREIITMSYQITPSSESELVIYDEPKVYTLEYQTLLKDFLTIF
ncbi:hypothetical protein A0256_17700 [Mucilaginibacter sp. PAMC 26640]|nr:hypothetical protein A0256_17700 [Mucilaginibacter sp. PAMC 26640]